MLWNWMGWWVNDKGGLGTNKPGRTSGKMWITSHRPDANVE